MGAPHDHLIQFCFGVVQPNGMAWNTEKGLMYFVDTAANSITSYR